MALASARRLPGRAHATSQCAAPGHLGVAAHSARAARASSANGQRYNSGKLKISSDNPNLKTVDVLDGSQPLDVVGRVVWIWNGSRL